MSDGMRTERRGKPCICGHLKGEHRQSVVRVDGRQVAVRRECQVDRVRVGEIEPCACPQFEAVDG